MLFFLTPRFAALLLSLGELIWLHYLFVIHMYSLVSISSESLKSLGLRFSLVEVVVIIGPYKAQSNYDVPSSNIIQYPKKLK